MGFCKGLSYAQICSYDSRTGCFTQLDPIGLAGGMNSYGFAAGDPINFSDPFGLCKVELQFTTAGIVGNHATIVMTAADNTRTFYSGGPSGNGPSNGNQSSGRASGASSGSGGSSGQASGSKSNSANSSSPGSGPGAGANENSSYGSVTMTTGSYEPGKAEYQPNAPRATLLDDKGSCDKIRASFDAAMDAINASGQVYSPFTTNSNAAAHHLLRSAGILGADRSEFPVSLLPGWNQRLLSGGSGW